jgi:hypothetical protein
MFIGEAAKVSSNTREALQRIDEQEYDRSNNLKTGMGF